MSDKSHDPNQMTGAAMIVRASVDRLDMVGVLKARD